MSLNKLNSNQQTNKQQASWNFVVKKVKNVFSTHLHATFHVELKLHGHRVNEFFVLVSGSRNTTWKMAVSYHHQTILCRRNNQHIKALKQSQQLWPKEDQRSNKRKKNLHWWCTRSISLLVKFRLSLAPNQQRHPLNFQRSMTTYYVTELVYLTAVTKHISERFLKKIKNSYRIGYRSRQKVLAYVTAILAWNSLIIHDAIFVASGCSWFDELCSIAASTV